MSPPTIRQRIQARAELVSELRSHFDGLGFLEVQPPCVLPECVVDPYIDPVVISHGSGLGREAMYLQPSPELSMKRMLAAGSGSIYSVGPVFRGGEVGGHHRPEFTMLEWYEVGASKWEGIETLKKFAETIVGDPCETVSYIDVFEKYAGLNPIESSVSSLTNRIGDAILTAAIGDDRDSLLDVILSDHVQPNLHTSTIVYDYPVSQAALAKVSDEDPRCAGRFEWFCRGIELGNGYDELLDADVLIARTKVANQRRLASGRPSLPCPAGLVDAMRRGLPPSSGVAVGLERLLMVRASTDDIADVLVMPS